MICQNGMLVFVFFFFKQKTAYEMRISDWSSDVCSSDLLAVLFHDARLLAGGDGTVDPAGIRRGQCRAEGGDLWPGQHLVELQHDDGRDLPGYGTLRTGLGGRIRPYRAPGGINGE